MARMHSRARGKAASYRPVGRPKPEGGLSAKEIEKKVVELAKQGMSPSKIGNTLRDEHDTPDVKAVTGKRVAAILAEHDAAGELPEDILALIKKAVLIRKHLEDNKQDKPARRGLTLTESKIMRLTKYYKNAGKVRTDWHYNPKQASYLAE